MEVTDAEEYDRKADKPWTRLTPRDKVCDSALHFAEIGSNDHFKDFYCALFLMSKASTDGRSKFNHYPKLIGIKYKF